MQLAWMLCDHTAAWFSFVTNNSALTTVQLLEENRVYQVVPFMTHLELNHVKDDRSESQKAHMGQEAVKMINAGLQPEYRGRFKLQVRCSIVMIGASSVLNLGSAACLCCRASRKTALILCI